MSFSQKILVPTDFSPASALALDAAALLATQFGAEISLLYVYDPSLLTPFFAVPGAGSIINTVDRTPEFEATARGDLERLRKERLASIDKVELLVLQHPSAAEGICETATKTGCDLIVLSTHGRTGLSHMLIGSVAERVVRHASCPVLTLRSKAK
jgi:nucleotide-binding universal stress UspA family protein